MKLQFDEVISVTKIIKNVETPFYLLTDYKEDFGYLYYLKIDEDIITTITIYNQKNQIEYNYEITKNEMKHKDIWEEYNGKDRITEEEFQFIKLEMLEFIKNN